MAQPARSLAPRLQSIQLLRALAASGVVFQHCVDSYEIGARHLLPGVTHIGAYGVDLFFVISGFVICQSARSSTAATDFLRNRFIRVGPIYYLQTTPYLIGALATGKLALASLATSLLFWPMWGPLSSYPLLIVGWSLSFEAMFYSSLGAVVWLKRPGAVGLLITYAIALYLNLAGAAGVFNFIGNPLFLEFLLGVAIALAPRMDSPPAGLAMIGLGLLLFAYRGAHGLGYTDSGMMVFWPANALMRVTMAGPAAFFLVWGALQLEPWCRGVLVRSLSFVGDASYSIYLAHPLAIAGVIEVWRLTGAPIIMLPFAEGALSFLVGILSYKWIEKPLLARLRGRRSSRITPLAEVA